jgi:hypothetical protein
MIGKTNLFGLPAEVVPSLSGSLPLSLSESCREWKQVSLARRPNGARQEPDTLLKGISTVGRAASGVYDLELWEMTFCSREAL